MSSAEDICVLDLQDLLQHFSKNTYKARDTDKKVEVIQKKCLNYFAKDYKFSVISNANGELCGHYPVKIVILESRLEAGLESEKINDSDKLRDLFTKARFARCRSRFVVPVILFGDKNICRSATLSSAAEIYGRFGYDFLFSGGESIPEEEIGCSKDCSNNSNDWALFDRIRGQDIQLLKELKVDYICDLMVEKKKVKFGMNVTSSEKVDKAHRYSDFCLCCVPYPGCEFFRDFKSKGYSADGLYFDWKQDYVDAQFTVPEKLSFQLGIEWNLYKSWDLILLTQNYMLLLLSFIMDGEGGTLIHCISGWDRTPLFISLIRLSLWADKKVHASLSPAEILYLTIAYDWYLFGHDFADRIQKGEDVLYFCFNFLKYIGSDVFSVNTLRRNSISNRITRQRCDSEFDGAVLLDGWHSGGSNASLNSCSSVCSESRLSYFIGQETTEDVASSPVSTGIIPNGTDSSHSSPLTSVPYGLESGSRDHTSPLPVPLRPRNNSASDHRSSSSSICGSWQLVSGTGSPKGTTTANNISSTSLDSIGMSPRQQRLDSVRMLFHKVYAKAVGFPFPEGNAFASIIDHVTERIREGWSTVV